MANEAHMQTRHRANRISRPLLVGLSTLLLLLAPAHANDARFDDVMSGLRWQARVLLVFSADTADRRAQAFFEAVEHASCEIEARDLVIGHIVSTGRSHIDDVLLAQGDSDEARRRFRIGPAEFRVLLIGKDGGTKAAYTEPPDLDDVFGLIDGMPMRRRESRLDSSTCN